MKFFNIGHHARRFRESKSSLPLVGWSIVSVIVIAVGVRLFFRSHAATTLPTTSSLQNMCGVTSTYDASAYMSPAGQAPLSYADGSFTIAAYPKFLAAQGGAYQTGELHDFHIQSVGGTPYLFTMNSPTSGSIPTLSISALSNPSSILLTFPLIYMGNNANQFTVDPSGNIYIMSWFGTGGPSTPVLYQYSPFSGTNLSTNTSLTAAHTINLSYNPNGGVFGYVNSSGNFTVGLDQSITNQGSNQYNAVATAQLYNTSLASIGSNSIDAPNGVRQAANGDITSVDNGMLYVYTNAGQLKFSMGTGDNPGTSLNLSNATSAVENADGTYDIIGTSMGVSKFSSNGAYLGSSPDFQNQNNSNTTLGVNPKLLTQFNGNDYYYSQGLNVFASAVSNKTPGIFSITPAQLAIYTGYPQGTNGVLGLGAGLTTQASVTGSKAANNFFPSGTTPSVNLALYPWWSSKIANFTITYEVRTMAQIEANQPGTTQTVTVPALSSSAPSYIPLNLTGNTTPGAYEVSAHISSSGKTVGSDCLDYSVGAPGVAYNPSGANFGNPVEQAHELGQNFVRSEITLDGCLTNAALKAAGYNSTANTFSSMPVVNCSATGDTVSGQNNVLFTANSDAALAKQYGIKYMVDIDGKNTSQDYSLTNSQTSSCPGYAGTMNMFQCAVYQMATQIKSVTSWEAMNEFNVNGNASFFINNYLKPVYLATQAAGITNGETEQAVIGSQLAGQKGSAYQWSQLQAAGGYQYGTAIDNHPYVGDNRSFEDNGSVIPSIYATPTEAAGGYGVLQQIQAVAGGLPIYDSEFGIWQGGPASYYQQGNILVRGTIMQNSIGSTNVYVFQNSGCNKVEDLNWGTIGCGHDNGDAPGTAAQYTMQHMLDGATVSANRVFQQWLPTGLPHTYAAVYGPSGTDTGSVVVVWSDDYPTQIIPKLSSGGSMNITSEYGAVTTLANANTLNINGSVQYINIPAGQTVSFAPTETYGSNLALASSTNNVTASASTTAKSGSCNASNTVLGLDEINYLPGCGYSQTYGWAQAPGDASPTLTVSLPSAQNIDRLFIGSSTIHSVNDNLRGFTVQVSGDGGNTWTTVGTVNDNFFQRNFSFTFKTQSVNKIQIINMTPNFSGYAGGLAPVFWPTDATSLANASASWYGTDTIYDVEAYGPGQGAATTPPTLPNAPTGVKATVKSSASVGLSWTAATEPTGSTNSISGYNIFRNGTQINTALVTGVTYVDSATTAGTTYSYTVQAVDNANPANSSTLSTAVSVTTYPKPSTPTLSIASSTSSQVNLSWTASTSGPGIAAYYIVRTNGTTVTKLPAVNSPSTTFSDTTVSPANTYTYTVQAVDTAGDLSDISSPPISITTPNPPDTTAPSVPVISIGSSSYNSVVVNWTASTDTGGSGLAGYTLYRNGVAIGSFGISTLSYTDTTVSPVTAYSYTVSATDNAGNASSQSARATTTTPAKPIVYPTVPSGVSTTANAYNSVTVNWKASTDVGGPGIGGYYVERLNVTAKETTYTTIGQTTSTSFVDDATTDTSPPIGANQYSYQVVAFDTTTPTAILSGPSTVSSATTPQNPQTVAPQAPIVSLSTVSPVTSSQINLTWTEASSNVSSYTVYITNVGTGYKTSVSGITTTSYGFTGLAASTSYSFYVVAYNSAGIASPVSSPATLATTLALATATTTVVGVVSDSVTGLPIAGVNVKTGNVATANGSVSTTTNSAGQYILQGIIPNKGHSYFYSVTNYTSGRINISLPAGINTLNEQLTHK